MHLSQSTIKITRNYFPHLTIHEEENVDAKLPIEPPSQGLFCTQFSSPLFVARILRPQPARQNAKSTPFGAAFQSGSRFARISKFARIGDHSNKDGNTEGEEGGRAEGRSSWCEMPKFLLAGAVSTIISRTCVAPLERIKLECIIHGSALSWTNVIRHIWVSEGITGFWKGNTHCQIRTRLVAPGGEVLGGVTGCFTYMVRNEGFLSLYKGLTPALLSIGPASAVFYAVYDILKTSHLSSRRSRSQSGEEAELGPARTLLYGAFAGACAETVTYPLEVIRRQLQLEQAANMGLIATFIKVVERDGIGSLFTGLAPSTLQVLPSASLSYFFYEMMKSTLKIN